MGLFKKQEYGCGHLTSQREWSTKTLFDPQTIHVSHFESDPFLMPQPTSSSCPTATLSSQSKKTQAPAHKKHSWLSWKAEFAQASIFKADYTVSFGTTVRVAEFTPDACPSHLWSLWWPCPGFLVFASFCFTGAICILI